MSDQVILICENCVKIRCVPANDAYASPCDCGETKKFHTPTDNKVKEAIIEIIPKITQAGVTAAVGFFAPELIPWAYPFTLKALEVTTDHAIEKCGEWMQNRLYEEDNYQKQISSLFEKELKKRQNVKSSATLSRNKFKRRKKAETLARTVVNKRNNKLQIILRKLTEIITFGEEETNYIIDVPGAIH